MVYQCPSCKSVKHAAPPRCGLRVCARCCKAVAVHQQKVLQAAVKDMRSPRMLTLSLESDPDLEGAVQDLMDAWRRFRSTVAYKKKVRGAVAVLEITWSGYHGWHPHLHVIVDGDYWRQKDLAEVWCRSGRGP